MTIDWDNCPANTSFLEQDTDPENYGLSETQSATDQLRNALEKAYTKDKLSKQVKFNAVCLRKLKNLKNENKGIVRVKARIPELHSLIPKPKSESDFDTMSLYPTFIGLKNSFKNNIGDSEEDIPPGTILLVTFGNMSNFGQPRILEIGNIIDSNARSRNSGDDEDGPFTRRGASTQRYTGIDLTKLSEKFKGDKEINFKIPMHSYGTPEMEKLLRQLTNFARELNKGRVSYYGTVFVEDISRNYGETIVKKLNDTEYKPVHRSHQSGVDVDISIPILAEILVSGVIEREIVYQKEKAAKKGKPAIPELEIMQSIDVYDFDKSDPKNEKKWLWRFKDADAKYYLPKTKKMVNATPDTAQVLCIFYICALLDVRSVFYDRKFIKIAKDKADTDSMKTLVKKLLVDGKVDVSNFEKVYKKVKDGLGKKVITVDPISGEKTETGGWISHVSGHKNHFHIRVKGLGFNDARSPWGKQDKGPNEPTSINGNEITVVRP